MSLCHTKHLLISLKLHWHLKLRPSVRMNSKQKNKLLVVRRRLDSLLVCQWRAQMTKSVRDPSFRMNTNKPKSSNLLPVLHTAWPRSLKRNRTSSFKITRVLRLFSLLMRVSYHPTLMCQLLWPFSTMCAVNSTIWSVHRSKDYQILSSHAESAFLDHPSSFHQIRSVSTTILWILPCKCPRLLPTHLPSAKSLRSRILVLELWTLIGACLIRRTWIIQRKIPSALRLRRIRALIRRNSHSSLTSQRLSLQKQRTLHSKSLQNKRLSLAEANKFSKSRSHHLKALEISSLFCLPRLPSLKKRLKSPKIPLICPRLAPSAPFLWIWLLRRSALTWRSTRLFN